MLTTFYHSFSNFWWTFILAAPFPTILLQPSHMRSFSNTLSSAKQRLFQARATFFPCTILMLGSPPSFCHYPCSFSSIGAGLTIPPCFWWLTAYLAAGSTTLFDMVVAPTGCSYHWCFVPLFISVYRSLPSTCHSSYNEELQSPILLPPFPACFPATTFSLPLIFQQRTFPSPILSSFSGMFLGDFSRFTGYL